LQNMVLLWCRVWCRWVGPCRLGVWFVYFLVLTSCSQTPQHTHNRHVTRIYLEICSLVSECTWLDARERVRESRGWVCRLCVHVSMSMHALIHMRVSTRIASVHGQVQHRGATILLCCAPHVTSSYQSSMRSSPHEHFSRFVDLL